MTRASQPRVWRFLVVEDNPEIARLLQEALPESVESPDLSEIEISPDFQGAAEMLRKQNFDLIILDLKEGSTSSFGEVEDYTAGQRVFDELKSIRFVPVIFFTAWPHAVKLEENQFVRVVSKAEGVARVQDEIRAVFTTKLPDLSRHIAEVQREYMWGFSAHWRQMETSHDKADVAYLLARRLALSLESEARRMVRTIAGRSAPIADPKNIHPMEMYIFPPDTRNYFAGDILKDATGFEPTFWIILTPSCDFEQGGRIENILLAECTPLQATEEYKLWAQEQSPERLALLKELIADNRRKSQEDRFKFLPGTYFLRDSVIDFQKLRLAPFEEISRLEKIASLDSPFAESIIAKFSRYFGRLGTPDIDRAVVVRRLSEALNPSGV